VIPHEFSFDVELPRRAASGGMVADLTSRILESVGCGGGEAAALAHELEAALRASAAGANGSCSLTFSAHGGRLEIALTSDGARLWHALRPIS
jgi:hypothetical protein